MLFAANWYVTVLFSSISQIILFLQYNHRQISIQTLLHIWSCSSSTKRCSFDTRAGCSSSCSTRSIHGSSSCCRCCCFKAPNTPSSCSNSHTLRTVSYNLVYKDRLKANTGLVPSTFCYISAIFLLNENIIKYLDRFVFSKWNSDFVLR